jgi:peptidyl-prolyl cis-trans isomerase SurA
MNRFIILLILISNLLPQSQVDGVVALVGENVILQSEVYQNAQLLAMQNNVDVSNNPYLLNSFVEKSLDALIQQYVIFEYAKEDTLISISEEEVSDALDQQITSMISRAGSEDMLEEALGQSIRAFRKDYYEDLYKLMLIDRYKGSFLYNIKISRAEVEEFFYAYQDSLPLSEPVKKFSIIEVPILPGDVARQEALSFISSLADSITSGVSFSNLASKYSQDGSASSGGDLGWFHRGSLVKEFEEVAFSLENDEVSTPVETEYGYHLIQLIDKQGEKIRARHILYPVTPSESDREKALAEIRKAFYLIEKHPASFDSLSSSFSSIYKNRSQVHGFLPDRMIDPDIIEQLSSLADNQFSYPFEGGGGDSFVLLFLHKSKPGEKPSLDDSWEYLENMALQKKTGDKFDKWVSVIEESIFIKIF